MAREHPDYRDNLELLNRRFPDKDFFSVKEIQAYVGWKSDKTAYRHLSEYVNASGLAFKTDFAKFLCKKKKKGPDGRYG